MPCQPFNVPRRVLIIEDQKTVRELLSRYIASTPDFVVVGQAGTVAEALRLTMEERPDIVILDWVLEDELGLNYLLKLHADPAPAVLVFCAHVTVCSVRDALAAGACGYIEKSADFSCFVDALEAAATHQPYLSPEAARVLADPPSAGWASALSPRESEILRLVAMGLSSKQIGDQLGLSARTVENHRAGLGRRTGLRTIAELTVHAARLGLIEVGRDPGRAIPTDARSCCEAGGLP